MDQRKKLDKSDKIAKLEDINYVKYTPQAPLSDYVQALWLTRNLDNQGEKAFQLLSDCGSCVIMNFSDNLILKRNGTTHKIGHEAVVVGPSKNLFEISFVDQIYTLGINFQPGTGHVFLEGGIEPITESIEICNLHQFNEIHDFYKKIKQHLCSGTQDSTFKQIEEDLLHFLSQHHFKAQDKFEAILTLLELNQDNSIELLSEMSGFSVRDIQRKFKHYVGISPNVHQRIIKLNKVKTQLSRGEYDNLTQLALDNGYYDQAHFIREFKYFMNLTPKMYRKQRFG